MVKVGVSPRLLTNKLRFHCSVFTNYRWLQDSVLVLPSQAWSVRRKQLTPAFHFAIMEDFESTMKEHSHILVEELRKDPNRPILKHLLDVAIHTIVQTSFGTSFTSLEDSAPYRNGLRKIFDCLWSRDMSSMLEMLPWYYYNLSSNGKREIEAIEELNALLRNLLNERKKEYASGETRLHNGRKSFLDHVVEIQAREGGLTDDQIIGESNTVLVAGHETTSATVAWTLYFLCKHPEVQERVYLEIVEHLAGKPFDTVEVGSLSYLNMVVKESMRIQPTIPSIGRVLTESITVDGWTFPPGTEIEIMIYWIHRDPEYWPDPEKFDPERFSVENSQGRNPYAFVPFSAGPRNCIGQRFAVLESRILIAAIINNFKISTTQELGVDLRRDAVDLTSIPGPDFRIQFQPRE